MSDISGAPCRPRIATSQCPLRRRTPFKFGTPRGLEHMESSTGFRSQQGNLGPVLRTAWIFRSKPPTSGIDLSCSFQAQMPYPRKEAASYLPSSRCIVRSVTRQASMRIALTSCLLPDGRQWISSYEAKLHDTAGGILLTCAISESTIQNSCGESPTSNRPERSLCT